MAKRRKLSRDERAELERNVRVFCEAPLEARKRMLDDLKYTVDDLRDAARNPSHPVSRGHKMYRSITVRRAKRKLVMIAEFKRRVRSCAR